MYNKFKEMKNRQIQAYASLPNSPIRPNRMRYTSFQLSQTSQTISKTKNSIGKSITFEDIQYKKNFKKPQQNYDKLLKCDIDNFIQYILQKKQHNKNLQKLTIDLKQSKECKKQRIQAKKQQLVRSHQQFKAISQQNQKIIGLQRQQQVQIQSKTSLIVAKTFELQEQLEKQRKQQQKISYLEALNQAMKVDYISKEQQCLKIIRNLNQHRNSLTSQKQEYQEKIKLIKNLEQSIKKKKEDIDIIKRLNLCSKVIFEDLYGITTQKMKPQYQYPNTVINLASKLKQKQAIIQSGLKQCQEAQRFLKKMEYAGLLSKHQQSQKDNQINQDDLILKIYIEDLNGRNEIKQLEIDLESQTKKFHDLLSDTQLDQIRQKNTEVLYYLKKLQSEFKKKTTIISNLQKQLEQSNNKLH